MPAKTISIGEDIKSNLRTTDNLISYKDNRFSDMVERLGNINYKLGNLDENCEDINLPSIYDELKGIIKDAYNYDRVLKLKVKYREDPEIKTGKDLLDALYPKIDPDVATFDKTVPILVNILYEAIKEDS
jgi:hypothetical protein